MPNKINRSYIEVRMRDIQRTISKYIRKWRRSVVVYIHKHFALERRRIGPQWTYNNDRERARIAREYSSISGEMG